MSDSTPRALRDAFTATSMVGEDANVALALMRIAVALERLATAHERVAGDRDVEPLREVSR